MLDWLTLIAAAIAAVASIGTAVRQWRSWAVDRQATRFDAALARTLSNDPRTALIGEAQVTGMVQRKELPKGDAGYVRDTFAALTGPVAEEGPLEIESDTESGDNQDDHPGGSA